ncbi:TetR/AcrR family transcriptional regulator [Streptomyces sp. NBC_00879]|uniref:TetR/AcrR family transcriptional regulator n=1 Tax=Streptomyces sp. NBC_00879 TaxID=2975855 RepID=UPI00387063F0|nr:TetR/AcrR family transcriptional regulator [Streptomyces sp. NBC_00879]
MTSRLDQVLDAAYETFTKHGVRRATMEDIAKAAGMSRAAVYQYVRNKDDAFLRLAERLHGQALVRAGEAAAAEGTARERVRGILGVKLGLFQKVVEDSPHAAELIDAADRLCGPVVQQFTKDLHALLTEAFATAGTRTVTPAQAADIAIALVRGLELTPEAAALLHPAADALIVGLTGKDGP